jgi:ABC-type amino acid transport substrate-binding protein
LYFPYFNVDLIVLKSFNLSGVCYLKKILMKVNHLSRFFITLLCLLFSFFSLILQANSDLSLVEKKYRQQPLTIAISKLAYPYHYLDEEGKAKGFMIDYWKLWASKQNVEIKFIPLEWSETLRQVLSGEIDIHVGMLKTEERKKKFDYIEQFFTRESNLYLRRDLLKIENIEQLSPYAIGILKTSSHRDVLERKYPHLQLKAYESLDDLYDAALNNEIMVFAGLDKLPIYYARYDQLNRLFPSQKSLVYNKQFVGSAVSNHNPSLLSFINRGMDKISPEEYTAINRKWLGVGINNESLLLTFSPDFAPFTSLSTEGEPQGLLICA